MYYDMSSMFEGIGSDLSFLVTNFFEGAKKLKVMFLIASFISILEVRTLSLHKIECESIKTLYTSIKLTRRELQEVVQIHRHKPIIIRQGILHTTHDELVTLQEDDRM